jgi:hypothetical protein
MKVDSVIERFGADKEETVFATLVLISVHSICLVHKCWLSVYISKIFLETDQKIWTRAPLQDSDCGVPGRRAGHNNLRWFTSKSVSIFESPVATGTSNDFRSRLVRFYKHYLPEKPIDQVCTWLLINSKSIFLFLFLIFVVVDDSEY